MPSTDPTAPTAPIRYEWPTTQTTLSGYVYDPAGTSVGHSHPGIDISATLGQKVFAPESGTVEFAGWNNQGYGNLIIVKGLNGFRFFLAHLSQIGVKAGDAVSVGELIGKAGSTGNSTGPHLHFEVHSPTGAPVNPADIYGKSPTPGEEISAAPAGNVVSFTASSPDQKPGLVKGILDFFGNPGAAASGAATAAGDRVMTGIGQALGAVNWGNVFVFLLGLIIVVVGVAGLVTVEGSKVTGAALGAALKGE